MKIQSASNHGLEALLIPSFTEAHRLKLETRPKPASREPNIPVQSDTGRHLARITNEGTYIFKKEFNEGTTDGRK